MNTIGRNPNPRIMIRCPATGEPVYTGKHAYDSAILKGMHESGALLCPHCKATHAWNTDNAFLEP